MKVLLGVDPHKASFALAPVDEATGELLERAGFPQDRAAAEGEKVLSRLTTKRTHDRGEYLGFAPSGMEIKTTGIIIHRISEGKIVEEWSESSGLADAMRRRLERERIKRERIEQELQVARRIQQASLPKEVPILEGWEIIPYYQPSREVGGDFYDFHHLSEGRVGFVVGDATGKGVPAALVMSTTCGMLQSAARALGSSSPGEVLSQVNETLVARIPGSLPAPPKNLSLPGPPPAWSSPSPPYISSSSLPPFRKSAPRLPLMKSTPPPPCTESSPPKA